MNTRDPFPRKVVASGRFQSSAPSSGVQGDSPLSHKSSLSNEGSLTLIDNRSTPSMSNHPLDDSLGDSIAQAVEASLKDREPVVADWQGIRSLAEMLPTLDQRLASVTKNEQAIPKGLTADETDSKGMASLPLVDLFKEHSGPSRHDTLIDDSPSASDPHSRFDSYSDKVQDLRTLSEAIANHRSESETIADRNMNPGSVSPSITAFGGLADLSGSTSEEASPRFEVDGPASQLINPWQGISAASTANALSMSPFAGLSQSLSQFSQHGPGFGGSIESASNAGNFEDAAISGIGASVSEIFANQLDSSTLNSSRFGMDQDMTQGLGLQHFSGSDSYSQSNASPLVSRDGSSQGPGGSTDLSKTNELLQQLIEEVRKGRQGFLPIGDRNVSY